MSKDKDILVDIANWAAYKSYGEIVNCCIGKITELEGVEDFILPPRLFKRLEFFELQNASSQLSYENIDETFKTLEMFDNLHIKYLDELSEKKGKTYQDWLNIRQSLLLLAGFSILLLHLKIDDFTDATYFDTFTTPASFKYTEYIKEVDGVLSELKYLNLDDKSHQDIHQKEEQYFKKALLMLWEIRDPKKKVSNDLLFYLSSQCNIDRITRELRTYISDIEDKILNIPTIQGSIAVESNKEVINKIAEPEWSNSSRKESGPYRSLKKSNKLSSPSPSLINEVLSITKPPLQEIIISQTQAESETPIVNNLIKVREEFIAKNNKYDPIQNIEFAVSKSAREISHNVNNKVSTTNYAEHEYTLGDDDFIPQRNYTYNAENRSLTADVSKKSLAGPRATAQSIEFEDIEEAPKDIIRRLQAAVETNVNVNRNLLPSLNQTEEPVQKKAKTAMIYQNNGRSRHRWSFDEDQALLDGIAKFGTGNWAQIKNHPDYSLALSNRTSIQIKDRYRNYLKSGILSKPDVVVHENDENITED